MIHIPKFPLNSNQIHVTSGGVNRQKNKEGVGRKMGDGSSSLEMDLGGQDWEPVHWWEKREGKRQADCADVCHLSNHSPLSCLYHAHTQHDRLSS